MIQDFGNYIIDLNYRNLRKLMKIELKKKNILVTGGTGNLGKNLIKNLIKHKANVIMLSRRKLDNHEVDFYKCDLTNQLELNEKLIVLKKKYKKIHGFVHLATSGNLGSFEKIDRDDFIRTFNINSVSFLEIIKQLYPLFKNSAQKNNDLCSVISVSSMYGMNIPDFDIYKKTEYQNPVSYGSSKSSLQHMTKYLTYEKKLKNIRFNTISPGAFPKKNSKFYNSIYAKKLEKKISLKRFGKPDEFSNVIIFLLSNFSSYINGSNIVVDGGFK